MRLDGRPREHTLHRGTSTATTPARWLCACLFASLLAVHLAWALGQPITAGVDEQAHVYRAVSLWSGQFVPEKQSYNGEWLVSVPQSLYEAAESGRCSNWKPDETADCAARVTEFPETGAAARTGAGQYPPLYYLVTGWPGKLLPSETGIYLMRALSVILNCLLLTTALLTLWRTVGPRWTTLAAALAVTPDVLWIQSVYNPNGLEVASALLVWSAGVALLTSASPESTRSLLVKLSFGMVLCLSTRRLSPLWILLILLLVAGARAALPPAWRRARPTRRQTTLLAALFGVFSAASVLWHARFDLPSMTNAPGRLDIELPWIVRLLAVSRDPLAWIWQTYGSFGWFDTPAPLRAAQAWFVFYIVVTVACFVVARNRMRLLVVLGSALVAWLVIPLGFETVYGPKLMFHYWNARYSLPLSQGVPMVMVVVTAAWWRRRGLHLHPRAATTVQAAVATAGVAGLVYSLAVDIHRYTSGYNMPWTLTAVKWTPVLGLGGTAALALVGHLGVLALLLFRARRSAGGPREPGRSGTGQPQDADELVVGEQPSERPREGERVLAQHLEP